jgi:hypothetical protein
MNFPEAYVKVTSNKATVTTMVMKDLNVIVGHITPMTIPRMTLQSTMMEIQSSMRRLLNTALSS